MVEDLGPGFVAFVAGEQDGAAFVAVADDLKQQVGTLFGASVSPIISSFLFFPCHVLVSPEEFSHRGK